jgi:hypothetical protein
VMCGVSRSGRFNTSGARNWDMMRDAPQSG